MTAKDGRAEAGGATGTILFDSHAHFFSDDIARYPLNAANKREGEEALTRRILAEPGTPERIFAQWDAHSVKRGAAVQYNNAYKTDNSYLLDVAEQHRERVGAVVILDAQAPDTVDRLAAMVTNRSVQGLRLVGFTDAAGRVPWLENEQARGVLAQANRLGIAVVLMIRMQADQLPDQALALVHELAGQFPDLTIVMDHFAWPGKAGSAKAALTPAHVALADRKNIYFKLTSINIEHFNRTGLSSADFIRAAAELYGADRLMWGSDYGNTLRPYGDMVADAVEAASGLNAEERHAFLYKTADTIFGPR